VLACDIMSSPHTSRRCGMHAPVSTTDVDVWRHFETRQASWEIERRHLQMQLARQRKEKQAKDRAHSERVAYRAKRTATEWKREDDLVSAHERMLLSTAGQEQGTRNAEDTLHEMSSSLHEDGATKLHLSDRRTLEERDQSTDDQRGNRGTSHYRATMNAGAAEFALERREFAEHRKEALRSFGWAKADEELEASLHATVSQQLPTGPGARGHLQTPGRWRADLQTIEPGAWVNEATDAEVQRAKTTQMQEHVRSVRNYEARRDTVVGMLNKWGDVQERVTDAKYAAWRTKVDANTSPRTPSWPDKQTHRVGLQLHTPVLSSPRRLANR